MVQLSKKDYDYCKTVYEELLSGAFSKDKVRKAYEIMFGNKGEIINNKKKRAQVFSYWTKEWVEVKPTASKSVEPKVEPKEEQLVEDEVKPKKTRAKRKKKEEDE